MRGRSIAVRVEPRPESGYVKICVGGVLTADAALKLQARVVREYPGLHRLWDFRSAELTSWTADQMRDFAATTGSEQAGGARQRVAAVVKRDVDFGIARMFQALAPADSPIEYVGVFRDEAEARRWLEGCPPPA